MAYERNPQRFRLAVWKDPKPARILIEGDSWADHPLVHNLSWHLHLYLGDKAHILNIAESGDLIYNMATGKQFNKLKAYLKSKVLNFELMFLSGGGNDILANDDPEYSLDSIVQQGEGDDPRIYINPEAWDKALGRVRDAYDKILSTTASINPNIQIVAHTYDYIYPRDNGTDIIVIPDVLGPWAWPVMEEKGITDQLLQRRICNVFLDDFRDMLMDLQNTYRDQFHVVDTLGTLPDLTKWGLTIPNWDDEIHPDSKGFKTLIDERIGPEVERLIS